MRIVNQKITNGFLYLKKYLLKEWQVKLLILFILSVFVLFDLITKEIAFNKLMIKVKATNSLFFEYHSNSGLFFGLLANSEDWAYAIQFLILIIALGGIIFNSSVNYLIALLWIGAGGFGNVLDRFDDGRVVDFISFDEQVYFNLSDTYVIIGILFILYALFMTEDDDIKEIKKLGLKSRNKNKSR